MPVIVTPGAADANSYASETEFKAYRVNRYPQVPAALTAPDASITAALIVATRSLDANIDWTGIAVDAVQVLTWPRNGMFTRNKFAIDPTTIPQPLKDADCELAYQLLAGVDLLSDNDAEKLGVVGAQAGTVRVQFQRDPLTTFAAADIFLRRMTSEFNYLSVAIPGEVRRLLPEAWFNQPTIFRPLLIRSF